MKDLIKKQGDMIRKESGMKLSEVSLKRFKVYVSGESEPLILMGKDMKAVKHLAHQMIQNSSVRIKKVVRDD